MLGSKTQVRPTSTQAPRLKSILTKRRGSFAPTTDMTFLTRVAGARLPKHLLKRHLTILNLVRTRATLSTVGKSYRFNFYFFQNNPFCSPFESTTFHFFTSYPSLCLSSFPFPSLRHLAPPSPTGRPGMLYPLNLTRSLSFTSLILLWKMNLSFVDSIHPTWSWIIFVFYLYLCFSCLRRWIIVLRIPGLKRNFLKRPLNILVVY